jgi:hypothetical protein
MYPHDATFPTDTERGLTKREHIAIELMAALLTRCTVIPGKGSTSPQLHAYSLEEAATLAVHGADVLLQILK